MKMEKELNELGFKEIPCGEFEVGAYVSPYGHVECHIKRKWLDKGRDCSFLRKMFYISNRHGYVFVGYSDSDGEIFKLAIQLCLDRCFKHHDEGELTPIFSMLGEAHGVGYTDGTKEAYGYIERNFRNYSQCISEEQLKDAKNVLVR